MKDNLSNDEVENLSEEFRSPQSDIEVPKIRKRNTESTETLVLDPLAVTKDNMSTNRRPNDHAFTQQRLFGWQPILTPYNVLPVLFILGIIFVPIGIVFLTASMGVQEYVFDYSECSAKSNEYVDIPNGGSFKKPSDNLCEIKFSVLEDMKAPVAVYYRLTNFYQNNRLYAKSLSSAQLKGEAILDKNNLWECDPLIAGENNKIYYPCGLIANSYFTDQFSQLMSEDGSTIIPISSSKISWPGDEKLYAKSLYKLENVVPPMSWQKLGNYPELNIVNGEYSDIPDLSLNERFQNWMKISGLPTFRKLYGRLDLTSTNGVLKKGDYILTINDYYDVTSYKGTKSFVISTTNWAGGKNDSLGIGFIAVGGLLLLLGLIFLVMFMNAPRKVGDVSYLSWYSENSGDPLGIEEVDDEEIQNNDI